MKTMKKMAKARFLEYAGTMTERNQENGHRLTASALVPPLLTRPFAFSGGGSAPGELEAFRSKL